MIDVIEILNSCLTLGAESQFCTKNILVTFISSKVPFDMRLVQFFFFFLTTSID